jgi:hypothetical protein
LPEPSVPERGADARAATPPAAPVDAAAAADANRVVFRHDLAVFALLAWVGVWAGVVVTVDPADRPALAAAALAVALAGAAVGVVPSVVVDDGGLTVVNPWTTLRIGWAHVRDVSMGWALTVTTDAGVHQAWAVPGPRRMRSMWECHWTDEEGVRERDSLVALRGSSARGEGCLGLGDAALIVAQRWAARGALTGRAPLVASSSLLPRVLLVAAAGSAAAAVVLAL